MSSRLKGIVSKQEFSVVAIFTILFIVVAIMEPNFFEARSIVRNINAFTPLILLTMGQAIVIISGNIDLSAGANLSLQLVILTFVMRSDSPITGVYALLITFAVAILMGVLNGIGAGYLRIPSLILTFATSFICLGAALFIRPTPGGQVTNWFRGFFNFNAVTYAPDWLRRLGEFTPPGLYLILLAGLLWYLVSKTKTGRYIYAVGSNRDNAYASGINTARIQLTAYVLNSMIIFLAAVYFAAQNQSGDARMGDPMTLRAIAATVVGGVALTGGRGSVFLAVLGALILSFVNKIIFFANVPHAFQTLANGIIVILAISTSIIYTFIGKKLAKRSGE